MKKRLLYVFLAGYAGLFLTSCGGGSSSTSTSPSSTVTSVAVTCSPTTVAIGGTSQCTSTVQGTGSFSSAVTWSTTAGTISSGGVLTGPSSASTATVTATSTQDTTKTGTAKITIQAAAPPTITSVAVSCTPTTVAVGGTSQCTASVQGTGSYSSAVTWTASAGTVTSSGLFTAPSSAATVTITATSTEDATKSGNASVTVSSTAGPTITAVAVSCSPTSIAVSATSQCAATVQGTGSYSSAVTWTTTAGTITSSGLLTAPATAATAMVTATSVEDPTKFGEANVTVTTTPAAKHIVMIVEENQSYSTVVGQAAWPNLNYLISNGALATNYYADTHPSIGNYFMLTTGVVLTNDDNSVAVQTADNIARRMLASGVSFRIYAEGITNGYVGDNTGLYLVRHNPFALLSDIANDPTVANQTIWPFSQFATDLANNALPQFSFIVPNVNDDAHNGTPQAADSWLQTNLITPLSGNSAFQSGGDGILIVDFDEAATSDTTNGGGHVSPVFWGPNVKAGYTQTSTTLYQHESMLRTIMDQLGLPNPPGAAATAPSMTEFFAQ